MSTLPDEVWLRILELGAASSILGYRDLCRVAIASRRLNRLSQEPSLWGALLALDFPFSGSETPSKSLYKIKFEKDKARRIAMRRMAVIGAEERVLLTKKKLADLELSMAREGERMKATLEELENLERVRSASVALNVWQPEVVRGRQKQIVEQCTVPVESRLNALRMEARVCKKQIETFKKAYHNEKLKLSEYEEKLRSLKYHPLSSDQLIGTVDSLNPKRQKLKHSHSEKSY
ncbi:F-box protein SKIP24 isoform X2 [Ananas comosus]|uniref:F-box protein SKIP24 n=2 Tax=Ananas comosus TaxID=4615 RepID=A0A199VH00_ANACO|nr:F-box protein SKIP24 isoform X2 [Ananas comosus]OAY76402.1 F-box protein SKIP24 [Ananas comosus]OAY85764.1 F-box protein SKIP24 [Ananas comosus]CAD1817412.1 unnamed protein product [Ananas comosus var. bracteatus]